MSAYDDPDSPDYREFSVSDGRLTPDEKEIERLEREVKRLTAALTHQTELTRVAEKAKDAAYFERNNLVAALARLFPSGIRRTDIPGWSEDWHGCVLIDLPSGQISYHYHDSQAHLFAGLPPYTKPWDGHDKEIVHARLAALAPSQAVEEMRRGLWTHCPHCAKSLKIESADIRAAIAKGTTS